MFQLCLHAMHLRIRTKSRGQKKVSPSPRNCLVLLLSILYWHFLKKTKFFLYWHDTLTYAHGTRDPQVVGGVNLVSYVTPRVVPRTFYSRNKFEHFDEKKKRRISPRQVERSHREPFSQKEKGLTETRFFFFPILFNQK